MSSSAAVKSSRGINGLCHDAGNLSYLATGIDTDRCRLYLSYLALSDGAEASIDKANTDRGKGMSCRRQRGDWLDNDYISCGFSAQ